MPFSPQPPQSPHLLSTTTDSIPLVSNEAQEVEVEDNTIPSNSNLDTDFNNSFRTSPKSINNPIAQPISNNLTSPSPNYPPTFFQSPSGHVNTSTTTATTSTSRRNSFIALPTTNDEVIYPVESYAIPQVRSSSSIGNIQINSIDLKEEEGTSGIVLPSVDELIESTIGSRSGVITVGSSYLNQLEIDRWDQESQQRMNLPSQYDYSRRASEAAYPYDRNLSSNVNGTTSTSDLTGDDINSTIPARPGSADGYFYVAPTTIANHLALPSERDAPLYYTYGGYSSQPTFNGPGNTGNYSNYATGPIPDSNDSNSLPSTSTSNIATTSNLDSIPFTSTSTRPSPSTGPAPPLYEKEVGNTEERNYKCDQCPHAFHRNHDLKRHKRIHLEIKPYPCHWCSKRFTRKDALKRHLLVKQHPAAPPVTGAIINSFPSIPVSLPTTSTKKSPKLGKKALAAAAAALAQSNLELGLHTSEGNGSHHSNEGDQEYRPNDIGIGPNHYLSNGSPTLPPLTLNSLILPSPTGGSQPTRELSRRTRRSTGAPQYLYDEMDEEEEEEAREDSRREREREIVRESHQQQQQLHHLQQQQLQQEQQQQQQQIQQQQPSPYQQHANMFQQQDHHAQHAQHQQHQHQQQQQQQQQNHYQQQQQHQLQQSQMLQQQHYHQQQHNQQQQNQQDRW